MADQQKISVQDSDAQFLGNLPEDLSFSYYGSYLPKYVNSTTIPGLNAADVSPLHAITEPVGFTLAQDQISALSIDGRGRNPVDLLGVFNNLINLEGLRELIIILDGDLLFHEVELPHQLQYLEIRAPNNQISMPDISRLTDLSVLVINASFKDIPRFDETPNIQRLVMKSNTETRFPESICKLSELVWLEYGHSFDTFPRALSKLSKLVILDLISDRLSELPDIFHSLEKLQHLSLEFPTISELPPSLGQLKNLSDLYLWNLPFTEIPAQVFNLVSLRYFWMKDNKQFQGSLQSIPPGIGKLSQLQDLQLNGNQIQEIAEELGQLTNLKSLKLGSNQIRSLPPTICSLSNLERLELYYNPIKELPSNLGDLRALTHLDVSDTAITKLPSSFAKLSQLREFDAIGCNLVELPESIVELDPSQFHQFHVTLRLPKDHLHQKIQIWLDHMEDYSNSEEDISFEYSIYQAENEDKVLLEDAEIDLIIEEHHKLDTEIRSILKQSLEDNLAHPNLNQFLATLPRDRVFEKPKGVDHSIYDLLYHINMSLHDILSYISEEDYQAPQWPDQYWDDKPSTSLPASELIQELIDEIESGYDQVVSILDDTSQSLLTTVPSQSEHTIFRELIIVLSHHSYHLGQLIQLKKLLLSDN